MGERSIHQIHRKLYFWVRKTHIITLPNYFLGAFECDLFTVTDKEFVVEYEVKISKSDYKADFLKSKTIGWKDETRVFKHSLIKEGNRCHRFYFVVPKGLIDKSEVPQYCGLITWDEWEGFKTVKRAPVLGDFGLSRDFFKKLAWSCAFREGNIRAKYKYKTHHG
jgi:hypothetical protein